ncbi:hypothetical protein RQP46_007514 [Phenoliferia psychrophenolica]
MVLDPSILVQDQGATLVPFAFWFETQFNNTKQIPQCAQWWLTTLANPNAKEVPTPPFYVQVLAEGFPVQAVETSDKMLATGLWTVNYPPGTNMTLAMLDSRGSTGGSVEGYSVVPADNNYGGNMTCVTASAVTNVKLSVNPTEYPCEDIEFDIQGGKAPYNLTIVNPFQVINPSPVDTSFSVFVTDSTGTSSKARTMTSGLGNVGCFPVQNLHNSESHTGAIAGGTVGGVAGLVLVLVAAWLLWRRRRKANLEANKHQGLETVQVAPSSTGAASPPQSPAKSPASYSGRPEVQGGGYAGYIGRKSESSTPPTPAPGYSSYNHQNLEDPAAFVPRT